MKIPEHCLARLEAAGLMVSDPFVPRHVAYPDGVMVGKPASVPGNCIPGIECYWGAEGILVDAPCPVVHYLDGNWFVTVHEYVPGPGPGDFVTIWKSPEQAVADVLEYFFGDSSRMEAGPKPYRR